MELPSRRKFRSEFCRCFFSPIRPCLIPSTWVDKCHWSLYMYPRCQSHVPGDVCTNCTMDHTILLSTAGVSVLVPILDVKT